MPITRALRIGDTVWCPVQERREPIDFEHCRECPNRRWTHRSSVVCAVDVDLLKPDAPPATFNR